MSPREQSLLALCLFRRMMAYHTKPLSWHWLSSPHSPTNSFYASISYIQTTAHKQSWMEHICLEWTCLLLCIFRFEMDPLSRYLAGRGSNNGEKHGLFAMHCFWISTQIEGARRCASTWTETLTDYLSLCPVLFQKNCKNLKRELTRLECKPTLLLSLQNSSRNPAMHVLCYRKLKAALL